MKCAACVATFAPRGRKRFCSKFCKDVFLGNRRIGPQGAVITCAECGERKAVVHPKKKACHRCYPEWVRRDNMRRAREYEVTGAAREKKREHNKRYKAEHRERLREANRRDNERLRRRRGIQPRAPRPGRELVLSDVLWGRGRRPVEPQSALILTGAICPQCEVAFVYTGTVANRYCSKKCRKAAGRRIDRGKRRGRERAGERIDIVRVAERDGWRCHICRRKVTRKTWSIDHLVPLSDDGPHRYENVALAHHLCNSRRGARGAAQLRLVG